jgi:two-component system sensor histidine kinase KdpD
VTANSRLPASITAEIHHIAVDGKRIVIAVAAVVATSALMLPFRDQLGVLNITLLFLLLSFMLGLGLGTRPAIVGALLSFLSFDILFLEPYLTLTVAAPDHVLALILYLAAAIVSSVLVSRVRERTRELEREAQRTSLLYDLNRALVQEPTLASLLQTITRSVVEIYGAHGCRMLTWSNGDLFQVRARWPGELSSEVDRVEATMARWSMESGQLAGLGTDGRTVRGPHGLQDRPREFRSRRTTDILYVPVTTPAGVRGVLEVQGRPGGGAFRQEDKVLLGSFADQAALALERTRLVEEAMKSAVLEQTSELKSSLIAAVSHDLRTPLTAIKASASAMLDESVAWSDDDRRALLETIDEETDRLTFMVSNLLDLSRIEGGALRPDKDWHDVGELIEDAVRRASWFLVDGNLRIEIEPDLPLVALDWVYTSQVLLNLLSNAGKYTPAGTPITVSARLQDAMLEIRVRDEGPGITPDKLPHIFETFYRAREGGAVTGSGIGLAICKGLVEAQGGTIRAESQPGKGATFVVRFPINENVP